MIAALLLALGCAADVSSRTPTPTYRWEHPGGAAAFRVLWKYSDRTAPGWDGSFDIPVELVTNEDNGAVTPFASGWKLDFPVQRAIPGQGVLIRFAVRALDAQGRESYLDAEQTLCLPAICNQGDRCE
jgi:hypothetical protein